ncbi:MAG: spermidine synthase [Actinomycetota bacterium]
MSQTPRTRFEELDARATPMGEISLRRRFDLTANTEVYEVKLGDEFLMSSLFTAGEVALADLAFRATATAELDVVVAGLGLGYTAAAVLGERRVRALAVVEALPEVIGWHEQGLLPMSERLTSDPRCTFVVGDFFAMISSQVRFGETGDAHDAILVDIDHSPRHHLHARHASFYEVAGQRRLAQRLAQGGVYALWSDDPPDARYVAVARSAFRRCEGHVVTFPNPLTGGESANTVYVATQ